MNSADVRQIADVPGRRIIRMQIPANDAAAGFRTGPAKSSMTLPEGVECFFGFKISDVLADENVPVRWRERRVLHMSADGESVGATALSDPDVIGSGA